MKKDLLTHFAFFISFFLLFSIFKKWFDTSYIALWIGGIIGTFLPDIDHLINVYVFNPKEADSKKVSTLVSQKEYIKTWDTLVQTQDNRKDLLFHSAFFQVLFIVFAFLIISTSGSKLGEGLVLAFLLHLLVDQLTDFVEKKNIDRWFEGLPIVLDSFQKRWYLVGNIALVLVFGFLL